MMTSPSTIHSVCTELNIPSSQINENIQAWIRTKVDDVLIRTLETASKLSHASKRGKKIKPKDITRALGMVTQPPIWLVGDDPKWMDAVSLGKNNTTTTSHHHHQNQHDGILFLSDVDVNIKRLASSDVLLPKYPIMPVFHTHWLAVDGIQPSIPENQHIQQSTTSSHHETIVSSSTNNKINNDDQEDTGTTAASNSVAPPVIAPLTKELRLFLEKIISVLQEDESQPMSGEDPRVRNVLTTLSNDPGLDQTVPHLVRYVYNRVHMNLRDLRALTTCVRISEALVSNPHLKSLDLYLHELLPSIITCLVGKNNCAMASEDHWSLRDSSAQVISLICTLFGDRYPDIQPRICKILLDSLEHNKKPLTTQYGGIIGLTALGPLVVENILIPYLIQHDWYLVELLNLTNSVVDGSSKSSTSISTSISMTDEATSLLLSPTDMIRKYEATRVLNAIRSAITPFSVGMTNKSVIGGLSERLGLEIAGMVKEFGGRFI
jgi:transcription initiation factor TFIID subunit 6